MNKGMIIAEEEEELFQIETVRHTKSRTWRRWINVSVGIYALALHFVLIVVLNTKEKSSSIPHASPGNNRGMVNITEATFPSLTMNS